MPKSKNAINTVNVTADPPLNENVKKRGRKSKKEIEEAKEKLENTISNKNTEQDNIIVSIKEECTNDIIGEVNENIDSNNLLEITDTSYPLNDTKNVGKKRGRKPKGGKIIQQILPLNNNKDIRPNIILHLKCSLKDLQNSSSIENNIESYNFSSKNNISYEIISNNDSLFQNNFNENKPIIAERCDDDDDYLVEEDDFYKKKDNETKDTWKNIKLLQHNLHINNISDKKSACFWCTYDFDNPPVYIPKHYIKDSYTVYGCFCSPECATAHLMEENIDSSSKFERYHLINHIYSKIYDYKKNIKPAPNPYYMLDKYYGNLSIQEFRSLLKNERLFLIVDKPLTRVLPELHEDNDDFIINNKIIPSNAYQIKKRLNKKQTKNNILNEKFGMQ
uniref:MYM-type domain-containing protein n=1 Tax=viral metagenome TaxID=1070528 RepID=A0A6C0EVL4_9ZZZZ